jgi:hypothetical protein
MTTGTAASSPTPDTVVDTVVLRYFLLVGRADLLINLLGTPIAIPRIIFDPDEAEDLPEDVKSEVRRSIAVQRRWSTEPARPNEARDDAALKARRLGGVFELHSEGSLAIIDLTDDERQLFGRLIDRESLSDFVLSVPLDVGEAACVAIAVHRKWRLATDDQDALRAAEGLDDRLERLRIRSLLRHAADQGLITQVEANSIHAEMRTMSFWDKEAPFPEEAGA